MMTTMLQYAWNGSRRGMLVLMGAFLVLQAFLFLNMNSLHLFTDSRVVTDQVSFAVFILSVIFFFIFLMVQTVQLYRKLLRSRLLQAAPVSSGYYLAVPLLLWTAAAVVLLLLAYVAVLLFLGTEAEANARLLMSAFDKMTFVKGAFLIITILSTMFGVYMNIFFSIALAKSIRTAKGMQVLLAFGIFALLAGASSWIYGKLEGIGPVFVLTDGVQILAQGNASLQVEMTSFPVIGMMFDLVVFVVLFIGTAYCIEKRVER
ncbi:hypothetical protein [Ectobacillus ponti]|uniref:Uncharacterized protein n=1 Tax=Ectobacillus ponti TaxID=2961894 RepID=A0AA41XAN5_9BACI|nr:hypothetical protein [Ectobacillus ponti]MCP8968551.1 hypothetical protein [Ectobacillus ponti]